MGKAALVPLALGVATTTAGCAFPSTDPTGIELSWRFVERNTVDGSDAVHPRSCAGAVTEQVAFEIVDLDDATRHATLRFDCLEGYQTSDELQIAASDAFVQLRPGDYAIEVFAVDDATDVPEQEQVETRDVTVERRRVTVQTWQFTRQTVGWDLDLRGTDGCQSLALGLHYAEPQTSLADFTPTDDDSLTPYRLGLASAQGLALDGEPTACQMAPDAVHRFEDLDRGEYILSLDVDGTVCEVLVDLSAPADGSSVIDLANLPCGG